MEEYTLREEHLEFYVTYPQLDGTKHEEINALLKERGLQIAESLLLEEEKRQEALSASSAPEKKGAVWSRLWEAAGVMCLPPIF